MACCCSGNNCNCTCCLYVNSRNLCQGGSAYLENWNTTFDQGLPVSGSYHKGQPGQTIGSGFYSAQPGPYYDLSLVYPTCTHDGGWTIGADWTLVMTQQYRPYEGENRVFQYQAPYATKTYKVRPTIEIDENGCPKITVGNFEFVSSTNVNNWNDTYVVWGETYTRTPYRPGPGDVLAALEPPSDLASSISLQCTPGNPLP